MNDEIVRTVLSLLLFVLCMAAIWSLVLWRMFAKEMAHTWREGLHELRLLNNTLNAMEKHMGHDYDSQDGIDTGEMDAKLGSDWEVEDMDSLGGLEDGR